MRDARCEMHRAWYNRSDWCDGNSTKPRYHSSARRSRILNPHDRTFSTIIKVGYYHFEESARMTVEAKNAGKAKGRSWSEDREGMCMILEVYHQVWYQSIRAFRGIGQKKVLDSFTGI